MDKWGIRCQVSGVRILNLYLYMQFVTNHRQCLMDKVHVFACGRMLKKYCAIDSDWPLSMAPTVQILIILVWPEAFFLPLWRVSLVITNEWEEAYSDWPIAVSDPCCNTYRMRLNRGVRPEARPQVAGPKVKCICIKGLKSHLCLEEWFCGVRRAFPDVHWHRRHSEGE